MDCLDWLHICHAECCRSLSFQVEMTPDLSRYFRLHAHVDGALVVTDTPCRALTKDNLCAIHECKPQVCVDFTRENKEKYHVPASCLYNQEE